jgi:hypothetical protein
MSSNIGIILSTLFIVFFVLIGGDMICVSNAYSQIDNISITIGYLISKSGRVDNKFVLNIERQYDIHFEQISPTAPNPGDVVDFTIYRYYHPMFIASNDMKIVAKRSTVIGYFG